MKKLQTKLRNFLKNKNIVDIFLIGSMFKDKSEPEDIDLILLFRDNNFNKNNELLYELKKSIGVENIHIEPLIVDNIQKSKIFFTILHEGYSLANGKRFSESLGYNSFSLFTFSLKNLAKIEKVQFAQALYGRKKDGLLKLEGGLSLGKGSFIAPVNKEELFKEMLNKFKISFLVKRALIKS